MGKKYKYRLVERHIQNQPTVKDYLKKLIENPQFKKWFGKSKVVDASGLPKIVYHGTNGRFDAFFPYDDIRLDYSRYKDEYGEEYADKWLKKYHNKVYDTKSKAEFKDISVHANYFFSDNYKVADGYSSSKDGRGTYECFLRMENPHVFDAKGEDWWQVNMESEFRKAKSNGSDGLIFKNMIDIGDYHTAEDIASNIYVVFDNKQIKSIGNVGSFDVDDANIYTENG